MEEQDWGHSQHSSTSQFQGSMLFQQGSNFILKHICKPIRYSHTAHWAIREKTKTNLLDQRGPNILTNSNKVIQQQLNKPKTIFEGQKNVRWFSIFNPRWWWRHITMFPELPKGNQRHLFSLDYYRISSESRCRIITKPCKEAKIIQKIPHERRGKHPLLYSGPESSFLQNMYSWCNSTKRDNIICFNHLMLNHIGTWQDFRKPSHFTSSISVSTTKCIARLWDTCQRYKFLPGQKDKDMDIYHSKNRQPRAMAGSCQTMIDHPTTWSRTKVPAGSHQHQHSQQLSQNHSS